MTVAPQCHVPKFTAILIRWDVSGPCLAGPLVSEPSPVPVTGHAHWRSQGSLDRHGNAYWTRIDTKALSNKSNLSGTGGDRP